MAKTTYWMRDQLGRRAIVTSADERDTWIPRGWVVADEPVDGEFVFMRHPDIADTALIPWAAREYWQGRGFEPSAPPEPQDPTRDSVLVDATEPEPAAPAVKSTPAAAPQSRES